MYQTVANWIDRLDLSNLPKEVVAFCFNLYDGCDGMNWSMELIGTDSYDPEDSDWACGEVSDFGSRGSQWSWVRNADWETVLAETVSSLKQYLEIGKYAHILKEKAAVAVGFVDGDLEILYSK